DRFDTSQPMGIPYMTFSELLNVSCLGFDPLIDLVDITLGSINTSSLFCGVDVMDCEIIDGGVHVNPETHSTEESTGQRYVDNAYLHDIPPHTTIE
ncbi:hypothetical protein KI387_035554, partial [Taxus chinensis]